MSFFFCKLFNNSVIIGVWNNLKGCDFLIEMKLATEKDILLIKETFKDQSIQVDSDFYMVVKDGEKVLGYATVILPSNEFAVIKELYIHSNERGIGFGDGLLRSTFNVVDLRGIRWVLVEGKAELEGFLKHEELALLDKTNIPEELAVALNKWEGNLEEYQYYFCEPKEFFSRKCKGIQKMRRL